MARVRAPTSLARSWRLALVISVVVILTAAITEVVVLTGNDGIDVTGQVIDTRTGTAVAGARISVHGRTAIADQAGNFRVHNVKRGRSVTIAAPNYRNAVVDAAKSVAVGLVPIPVTGTVTSALTSQPMTATIGSGANALGSSATDGSFTVYGVGPGDVLTVAAAGYQPAQATISEDRTTKAIVVPAADTAYGQLKDWIASHRYDDAVRWLLNRRTGLSFEEAPQNAEDFAAFLDGHPQLKATYEYWTVRGVTDTDAALYIEVFVPSSRPAPAGIAAFAARSLDDPTPATLGDQQVWHGSVAEGAPATLWWHDPVSIAVAGTSQEEADQVIAGIIRGQSLAAGTTAVSISGNDGSGVSEHHQPLLLRPRPEDVVHLLERVDRR